MEKEYKLKNVEEIVKVITEENIDVFLSDFSEWIKYRLALKKLVSEDFEVKIPDYFHWADDGIKGASEINIKMITLKQ